MPFGIATVLSNGRGTVAEFRESQLTNPSILRLARKVSIHHDDALDRAYPALWPSWCEIELSDGRTLRGQVNTTKGEPENPMTPPEVREKFKVLATTFWSDEEAHAVMETVENIEKIPVRQLMNFAARAVKGAVMTEKYSNEWTGKLYYQMVLIRRFEERLTGLYKEGVLPRLPASLYRARGNRRGRLRGSAC